MVYLNGKTQKSTNTVVKTKEEILEPEYIPNDIIETMTKEEIEETISKCDSHINTSKVLRSLSEGQYYYFIDSLKGRDDLPIALRIYR